MAFKVIAPLAILRVEGKPISSPGVKEIFSNSSFEELLDFFSSQFEFRYDVNLFLYRLYLQLVAKDWLCPTDKEIETAIWTIMSYM